MALPIDAKTFNQIQPKSGIQQMQEGDLLNGANKFMGQLNQSINGMSKLMEGWNTIKDKLVPQVKQQQQQTGGYKQPRQIQQVEPAIKPLPIPRTPEVETVIEEKTEEQKIVRAEEIFNELHTMVKPHLLLAKTVTAGYVIQIAMQPKNKERIIQEIAKRL